MTELEILKGVYDHALNELTNIKAKKNGFIEINRASNTNHPTVQRYIAILEQIEHELEILCNGVDADIIALENAAD